MHHDAIVRMNGYTSCMIYHRPCLQYCSWRSAWFVTRKQFDVHWNILHVAGHKSNDWKNNKNTHDAFVSCVDSATIFWVLLLKFAWNLMSHWWILQTKKEEPNRIRWSPNRRIRRGGSWSFLLHVDLWLGHALLMAPWIDESPWFGTPGAGRDSPPGLGGGKRWVYLYVYLIKTLRGIPESHKFFGGKWFHFVGKHMEHPKWLSNYFCSLLGCAYLVVQNSHCQGLLGRLEGSCLDLSTSLPNRRAIGCYKWGEMMAEQPPTQSSIEVSKRWPENLWQLH